MIPIRREIMTLAGTDSHRRWSMKMIVDAAELAASGRAVVLGCGRCGEIPLPLLSRRFDRVDLIDLDGQALAVAHEQWAVGSGGVARCHQADLTGLLPRVEERARELANRAPEASSCLTALTGLLDQSVPRFWEAEDGVAYDLVVCSGVLTQLQAVVRERIENALRERFPDGVGALLAGEAWRRAAWMFARRLEDGLIGHLAALTASGGIVYLADTVHVCWVRASDEGVLATEGAWVATRTPRLADYLRPWDEVMAERNWAWWREAREQARRGRLYGVQAIIYRVSGSCA